MIIYVFLLHLSVHRNTQSDGQSSRFPWLLDNSKVMSGNIKPGRHICVGDSVAKLPLNSTFLPIKRGAKNAHNIIDSNVINNYE